MKERSFFLLLLVLFIYGYSPAQTSKELIPYNNTIKEKGQEPVQFILNKLDHYDLILFDDGLHSAVEPFQFYGELIKNKKFNEKVKYIFLEAISVSEQPYLDNYFNSKDGDLTLLYPAFQNDFSGTGWPYETYFKLLRVIWQINSKLPEEGRYKVKAVNSPVYWKEITTPNDLYLFRFALAGNDYTMYKIISSYLDNFNFDKKGIFLTNTRHAYKKIKNKDNEYYWNCGTFFYKLKPGKTYSVRIHNINLYFEKRKAVDKSIVKTTEGLENVDVKWVRMENGLWDSAFKETGNNPVAFDMKDTPFGNTAYIGNHMLNAAPGQTIYDAYDALIFLAPLEQLHQTPIVDYIYTNKFKTELARRIRILYTKDQLAAKLKYENVKTIAEMIDKDFVAVPGMIQPLTKNIGKITAWQNK